MKVTREAKTAILVIGAVLLFIWGYSFLKGRDLFNSYKTYYVVYDNVEGLSPSAPVTLNGLVVGKVNSIAFRDTIKGTLVIELQVKTDFPISKTSAAILYEPGLGISGKQIAIAPDLTNHNQAENGDFLKSRLEPGMLAVVSDKLAPLQTKIEATVVSADSLLHNINNVIDTQTRENLRISIAEMRGTMQEFNKAAHTLNGTISGNRSNIDATMANLNRTSENFAAISDSINNANLGATMKRLDQSLANVDKIINDVQAGKGTMGKLLKDEAMYDNLRDASEELKELMADFKNNPKRYVHFSVFGKKNVPYTEEKNKK